MLRNLDEPLKLLGLLSTRSCGLLLLFHSASYALDLLLGFWSWILGDLALLAQIAVTALLGIALAAIERHEDEHHVPAAISFYLTRPWRSVYTGLVPDVSCRGDSGKLLMRGAGAA